MDDKNEELKKEMSASLNEKLPMPEVTSLIDEGFKIKNPKRRTAVMIALYKKAVSGDLSAIKELRSIVSGNTPEKDAKAVKIIEDI